MAVERPDDAQWEKIVRGYGMPEFRYRVGIPDPADDPECRPAHGSVVLLIFNLASSCVFIKRNLSDDWTLPIGLVREREGIMDTARRVALEKIGLVIEPVGVPLCEIAEYAHPNGALKRWNLVIVAETGSSIPTIQEGAGIKEARFFDRPPPIGDPAAMSWLNDLYAEGNRFMRSMDVMDGI